MIEAIREQGISCFVEEAKQPNLYFYFVNYIWHYLKENGKAGIILMTKFLNNKDGAFLKSFLLDKIEAVIAYPNNYFEGFKVTSVIVILAKKASKNIHFLNIKDTGLLENPQEIKAILEQPEVDISADYTLKVTDRNLNPSANWRLFLTDPEEKFNQLDNLDFFEPISTFFGAVKRGGAGNLGGSTMIYPNFNTVPFNKIASEFRGYGIKNSKAKRNYILEKQDLLAEEAIHFAAKYDENNSDGLDAESAKDNGLKQLFHHFNAKDSTKWRKIVNSTFGSQAEFDILIPRAERAKHSCYFSHFSDKVVLSTNFWYLTDFQNGNSVLSSEIQKKFIAAFLLSSFGQIQFEIHANNQEGLRKLEGFHINKFKIPDVRKLDKRAINKVVIAFEALNQRNPTFSGEEGLSTTRRDLDMAIGEIIYARNRLSFSYVGDLVNFFELFLADLVADRRQ